MSEFRPRPSPLPAVTRRPFWSHPAILWPVALLALLMLIRLVMGAVADPLNPAGGTSGRVVETSDEWTGAVAAPQAAATPAPPASRAPVDGQALVDGLNLTPGVGGYVVRPDDPALLAGTTLQTGDVLLEIDGRPLDPARVANLANEVGDFDDVEVRFVRNGQDRNTLLVFRPR